MNTLEQIVVNKIESINKENNIRQQKQEELMNIYTKKCQEIVDNLSFLCKYGFSLEIVKYLETDCGSTCGFFVKKVHLSRHNRHVAVLYPCPKSDKFDFCSWQLEMRQGWYTYETGVKALVAGRNFSGF